MAVVHIQSNPEAHLCSLLLLNNLQYMNLYFCFPLVTVARA